MAKKRLTPMEANTIEQVCELPRDNIDCNGFWILSDGCEVTIAKQEVGSPSTQKVNIPKPVFDYFVRWYATGKMFNKPRRRKEVSHA